MGPIYGSHTSRDGECGAGQLRGGEQVSGCTGRGEAQNGTAWAVGAVGGMGGGWDGIGCDAEEDSKGRHPASVAVAGHRDADAVDEPSTWAGGDGVPNGPAETARHTVLAVARRPGQWQ
eukprot:1500622-Rhodomonas_salina.1